MRFAAIDIGTNAARLLVGKVVDNGSGSYVEKISYTRIPLRLGESVFELGKISERKETDFVKSMEAFKLISEIFDVEQIRACATSAMREADNGEEVQKRILEETGVNIEIISGKEEAKLIFSTFTLMKLDDGVPFVVVDVGGGSTEVSVFENGERVASKSFKIGTIRLLKGVTQENIWQEMHDWLENHVDLSSVHRIFATGGNINKAHKILGAGHLEPIRIEAITDLRDELEPLSVKERINRFQLKPDRADVLVPALNIYLYVLETLGCSEIIVPKIGLSDGMIYNMYLQHNTINSSI